MLRSFVVVAAMLTATLDAEAQPSVGQQLDALFREAEQCYLIDDYERLGECIARYRSLLDACDKTLLADSLDVFRAYLLKMRGSWYYGLAADSTAKAEQCYRESMDVFRKRVATTTIPGMHPNEVTLHEELAQLYYKQRRYREAAAQIDTLLAYRDAHRFTDGDEVNYWKTCAHAAMCQARLGRFAEALRQIDDVLLFFEQRPQGDDYYEAQRRKAKILMLQADGAGDTRFDEACRSYAQYVEGQYKTIGNRLATMTASQRNQYWLSTHRFLYDCFRLGNHAPAMLYDLALFSKGYLLAYEQQGKKLKRTQWQQVQRQLGSDDCAIEFVQYFGRDDQRRMGCLVLTHNSRQPRFVDLFATDSVLSMKLSSAFNIVVGNAIKQTKPKGAMDKEYLYERSDALASLVWSPQLMEAIGNASNVYFAPDGMFNVLAIEYLMRDSTKNCYRLSSTRKLCQRRKAKPLSRALLCGGIVYDTQAQPDTDGNDVVAYRHLSSPGLRIPYLKGSLREVSTIDSLRNNPKDTLVTGSEVTDERFLTLLRRRYPLVVLSTHGFYHGDIGVGCDIKPLLGDHSMSQSGLIFAGAQTMLTDGKFDNRLYDGILSAAELSGKDLSHTELLMLSACETGLGRLTDDGVYGLVRGLKMAGAHALVLSLWEVNDAASCLFTQFFFANMQRQRVPDIHAAFFEARRQLASYEGGKFSAPYFTCPFILIDAY